VLAVGRSRSRLSFLPAVFAGLCCVGCCVLGCLGDGNAQTAAAGQAAPGAASPGDSANKAIPPAAFQAQANLVMVDAVVTSKGVPVTGLTAGGFHLSEDGKPQRITIFEEHRPGDLPSAAKSPPLPANVYSDFPEFSVSSAANVLLLDALNTPLSDQVYVRWQMLQYLKNIPAGTRIAVFTLASRLRIVQGFTGDSSVIARALAGKGGPQQSVVLDPASTQQLAGDTDDLSSMGSSTDAISSMQQFQADLSSFQTDLRVQMTLDAMKQLARYLSVIPGRKNLIWFSGSFPLAIDPDATMQSPFEAMRNYSEDVRETDDMLSEARVAVYPIDARGLMPLPSTSAANSYSSVPAGVSSAMSGGGRRGSRGMHSSGTGVAAPSSNMSAAAKADQQFLHQTIQEHASMQQIAEETGGEAFMDTNGLKDAVGEAVANGQHYYSIGYVPPLKKYDGTFHRIQLAVDGGYQAAYRRGYYADDPAKVTIDPRAAANEMTAAVARGAPPLSQILFKVRVLSADDPAVKTVVPAPGPAGATAKELKGPVKRYLIDYVVDAHRFTFTASPDGLQHAQVEFVVIAYDGDGKRLNYADRQIRLNLTSALYERLMRSALPMHQEIDLPAGQLYVRVVVHDLGSANVGATEIALAVPKR
jgi:VWFA-related protein